MTPILSPSPDLASSKKRGGWGGAGISIQDSPTLLVGMAAQIFMLESSICLAEAGVVLGRGYLVK